MKSELITILEMKYPSAKGLLYLLIPFLLQNVRSAPTEDCFKTMKLKHCSMDENTDTNKHWGIKYGQNSYFVIEMDDKCVGRGYNYLWVFRRAGSQSVLQVYKEFSERSILVIPASMGPAGDMLLDVIVSKKGTKDKKKFSCMVRMLLGNLNAAIAGGTYKYVHDNSVVDLDGSISYEAGYQVVQYTWRCESDTSEACNSFHSLGKTTKITIKGDISGVSNVFLTLTADGSSSEFQQVIEIIDSSMPVIDIIQNCQAAGQAEYYPEFTLNMEAVCYARCDQIGRYSWDGGGEPHGVQDSFLTIPPYTTWDKVTINAYAYDKYDEYKTVAQWGLGVKQEPTVSCDINPTEGTAISTKFVVTCTKTDDENDPNFFKFFQSSSASPGIPIAVTLTLDTDVRLAADDGMIWVVLAKDKLSAIIDIPVVQAQPLLAGKNSKDQIAELSKIINDGSENCRSPRILAKDGRVWEAIQIISGLLTELRVAEQTQEIQQFSHGYTVDIMDILLEFPLDSEPDGLIEIIPKLLLNVAEKNLATNVKLSEYCKGMAEKRRKQLSKEKYPLMQEVVISSHEPIFQECAKYLLDSRYAAPENLTKETNDTAPVDHQSNPEDYPNYKDVMTEQTEGGLKDIHVNALAVVALSNIISFYSQSRAAKPIKTLSYIFDICYSKDIDRDIQLDQCRLILPANLGLKDTELTRMCIYMTSKSKLAWDPNSKHMCTDLLNLILLDGNIEIVQLPEPIHIYLDAKTNSTFKRGNATLPKGATAFDNTNFPVYRIDVVKGGNVIIEIRKISSPHGLKVVIKRGKRPSLKDFANSTIIKTTGLVQIHKSDYDSWVYMAILPATAPITIRTKVKRAVDITYETDEKTDPSTAGITFEYRLISQRCAEWINGAWTTEGCELEKDSELELIHCTCRSLVNFAGFSTVPRHKLDEVTSVEIIVKFQWNFTIHILLFIVVLCYLIALCFEILRKPPYQYVYYLSDNKRTHAYGYLIRVKTNDVKGAGTSSNVTIKIIGTQKESKPHVLNYPDPDKNLMQTSNEDFFILATPHHLGDIRGIELWIDCMSLRPEWFCKHVQICDLQVHRWWKFRVYNRLSPLGGRYDYVSVRPARKTDKRNIWAILHDMAHCFRLRYGADHTWNIFSRNEDHHLLYTERIAVVLSHILTTYSLTLLVCAAPHFRNSDVIYQSFILSYLYTLKYAVILSLVSSSINYTFVLFYRCTTRTHHQPYAITRKILPPYVKYATSTLLILVLITNVLYLTYFSVGISHRASLVWLAITTLSLFLTIFVWENLFAGIFAVVHMYTQTHMEYHYDSIIREGKKQRAHLRKTLPKPYNLRPYLRHLYEPMSTERHARKQQEQDLRVQLSNTFKDMIAFLLYFCLLYILAGVNTDSHGIYLHHHFVDMFKGLPGRNHPALKDVSDLEKLYTYINRTVIETIHGHRWYGDYGVIDPGLMADFQTKFLGVARIRQKMVRYVPCPEREFSRKLFNITKCTPEYSEEYSYEKNLSKYSSIWTYRQDDGPNAKTGEMSRYLGGGYTTHLGRTADNAYYNVHEMISERWIYKNSRALFIEFWAYNANRNVFAIVSITIERSATGFIWKDIHVYPYSLMFSHISDEMLTLVVFAIFTIIMLYNLVGEIQQLVQYKWSYFTHFSNCMDVLVYAANLTVIGLFIHKEQLVDDLLTALDNSKKSEFVPYFSATNFCDALTILIGVLICVAVTKTWTFLRFGFMFRVFERTIKTQVSPLIGAAIFNIALLMVFIGSAFVLFSPHAADYRNAYRAFTLLSLLGLGQKSSYDHKYLAQYNPTFSHLFYVLFKFSMILMVNFYITIITINYEESKEYVSNLEKEYSVADHIKDEYNYYVKYFKRHRKYLVAGEHTGHYTEAATAGELLEIPKNRFEAMAAIAYAVIHNRHVRRHGKVARQTEFDVINAVVGCYYHKDAGDTIPYYHDVQPDGKVHFLTTNHMFAMEAIANRLLGIEPEPEPETFVETKVTPGIMKDTITLKRLTALENILDKLAKILTNINVVEVVNYDNW